MQMLQDQASDLKRKAWASSTAATYRTHMKSYMDFCDQISVPPLQATSETLQLYVTYLAKVKCFKFCSIQQYLNIIPHMHKLCDLPDPIPQDYQLKYLLMGVKRELGTAQSPVDTVTPSHLLRIRSLLDCSSIADLAFWCACLIAFYGLLRPGNVAITGRFEPSKHVRRIGSNAMSGAIYSVYGIQRQFNFENVSCMLSCHMLMVFCAQRQPFKHTFILREERICWDHYFLQEQPHLLLTLYSVRSFTPF